MFTNFQNKAMGFGVGTLVSSAQKNVFREDLSHKDLEMIWNEIQIQGEKNTCRKYLHSTWKWKSPPISRYGTRKTQGGKHTPNRGFQ